MKCRGERGNRVVPLALVQAGMILLALIVIGNAEGEEKTREYKVLSVRVRNSSATMHYHKNYYVTLVSGSVGKEGIPEVIRVGDTIRVKDRSIEREAYIGYRNS
jgi:hypothetical protein